MTAALASLRRTAAAWAACAAAAALMAPAAKAGTDEVAVAVDMFNKDIIGLLKAEMDAGTLGVESSLDIIKAHASSRFDFIRITRTAVGKHWRKADDAQRAALQDLFGALLEKTYAKTLAKFNGQELRFVDATEREANVYAVRFAVEHEGNEFKIEYLTDDASGDWRIFDVKVEGVSLIGSYRSQFSQVIRKNGIDALVEMLRERV